MEISQQRVPLNRDAGKDIGEKVSPETLVHVPNHIDLGARPLPAMLCVQSPEKLAEFSGDVFLISHDCGQTWESAKITSLRREDGSLICFEYWGPRATEYLMGIIPVQWGARRGGLLYSEDLVEGRVLVALLSHKETAAATFTSENSHRVLHVAQNLTDLALGLIETALCVKDWILGRPNPWGRSVLFSRESDVKVDEQDPRIGKSD